MYTQSTLNNYYYENILNIIMNIRMKIFLNSHFIFIPKTKNENS
jgi:hypothetical protein